MDAPFKVVIPARYASTRLPGKPLADIGGRPMVVRVVEQALRAGAGEVVVATDDERVAEAVRRAGHAAALTRADHASGSDRVMEVAAQCGWSDESLVVNVQGDEPLIPPAVIRHLAAAMAARPAIPVGTICERFDEPRLLFDPNVVKVVRAQDQRALYFSRAPIPFARDAFAAAGVSDTADALAAPAALPVGAAWYRHIGIYAFRVHALRQFVAWPMGALERLESLEQLRLLEHGVDLLVVETPEPVPGGVDTPADLGRVRAIVASRPAESDPMAFIFSLWMSIVSVCCNLAIAAVSSSFLVRRSFCRRAERSKLATLVFTSILLKGFVRKSNAPSLPASTARGMLPYAVMMITSASVK